MMKTYAARFGLVSAALSIALMSSVALGAIIGTTSPPVASGPGLGLVSVPAIFTPNPNNDNQTGGGPADNNVVIPLKRFDFGGYIDLEFTVGPSGGRTEYQFSEFVDNNTGVPWAIYTMQIGGGTGAGFTPGPFSGLNFDTPTYDAPPTSTILPVVALSTHQLVFSGGLQSTGAQLYTFRIDIPDISVTAPFTFTLRQFGTVPEPGSLLLIGLATLVGCAVRRRG